MFRGSSVIDEQFFGQNTPVEIIKFGEVNVNESYTLTELGNSPFKITTELDPTLIATANVTISMNPWYDANTGTTYTSINNRTMQANVEHTFELAFLDIYGNDISTVSDLDPPFFAVFEDNNGLVQYQNYSVPNELRTRL